MSILTTHSYIIPIVVLFLCFLIKIPISYSLFSASIVYCMFMGLDLGTICEKTMSTLYFKYVILAVPLFIFTANVLNSSKVSDYIFGFCKALIGKRKGALAYVNVLISLIFSGMSGSAFADASAVSGYALEALRWAVENGIINGYGNGQLAPQGLATRAQVAQMLKNFLGK